MLDSNSSVVTDELEKSTFAIAEIETNNSLVATDGLQKSDSQIDIFQTLKIPNIAEFPIEDFFKVPFTHHSRIIAGAKLM